MDATCLQFLLLGLLTTQILQLCFRDTDVCVCVTARYLPLLGNRGHENMSEMTEFHHPVNLTKVGLSLTHARTLHADIPCRCGHRRCSEISM